MCIQQRIKLFIQCNRVLTGFPHHRTTFSSKARYETQHSVFNCILYRRSARASKSASVLPISLLEACASREQYLWEILCHHRQITVAALSFPAAASRPSWSVRSPLAGFLASGAQLSVRAAFESPYPLPKILQSFRGGGVCSYHQHLYCFYKYFHPRTAYHTRAKMASAIHSKNVI